jgi:hypothetical protein
MIPAPVTQWHRLLRRITFIVSACMMLCNVFFITSCINSQHEEQKENTVADDSLQTVNSITSEDSLMIFNNSAQNWISNSIKKTNIDWNRFHLEEFWNDDSLQVNPFKPEADFYKDYAQVLRWSPDSNYVLDIGSYGSVKIKDNKTGNTKIESGEPDTEISIIYPKTKVKARLMFFGPGTVITDGRWLDASQVAVLGINNETADHSADTLLWIVNTKENFFRKYKWQ